MMFNINNIEEDIMTTKEKIIELKGQYRLLSEVEELWGVKPSKHKAYIFVQKRMCSIIKELQKLEKHYWNLCVVKILWDFWTMPTYHL